MSHIVILSYNNILLTREKYRLVFLFGFLYSFITPRVPRMTYIYNHRLDDDQLTHIRKADQKNSLVSGPPTDPATTPPTVNFLQQSEQKKNNVI